MAETPTSGPFSEKRRSQALKQINRGPSGVKGALLRVGAVIGLVAVPTATIEATLHPTENLIDGAKSAATQQVGNIQQGTEALVNFYDEDPKIEQYNRDVASRLSGKSPLLDGEQIFEKVTVVAAGENLTEQLQMKNE